MVTAPLTRENLREELDRLRDEIRPPITRPSPISLNWKLRLIKRMIGLMVASVAVANSLAVSVQMFTG